MQPTEKTSDAATYSPPRATSGAAVDIVPAALTLRLWPEPSSVLRDTRLRPKSMIFTTRSSPATAMTFGSFKSRCTMDRPWRYATARRICSAQALSAGSPSSPANLPSSVPSQYSMTSTSRVSSQNASRRWTIAGWSTVRSTSISWRSSAMRPFVPRPAKSTNLPTKRCVGATSLSSLPLADRCSDRLPDGRFFIRDTVPMAPAPRCRRIS
mmetsp:Transcript_25812/g.88247  ORF Transcript_25812/g.88247 Transcript_25812/m.88247 type:complete len:211 (-) Transcript_25812:265-897(-)